MTDCIWCKTYLFIIIYWIIEIGTYLIKNIYNDDFKLVKGNKENEFIDLIDINISDLLSGFVIIYIKYSNRENKSNQNKNDLIYSNNIDIKEKNLFFLIILIILISILDIIGNSVHFLFYIFFNKNLKLKRYLFVWIVALDIIFRYLFSSIILKIKLNNLHMNYILISLIGFFIIYFINFIFSVFYDREKTNIYNIYYFLFILIRSIFIPLEDVLNKILFKEYFLFPHSLMFIRGVIKFFILLITFIFFILNKNLNFAFNNSNIFNIFLIKIIYIFIYSLKTFCLMNVIYIFSSEYVSLLVLAKLFGNILYAFYSNYYNNIYYHFMEIISLVIIFYGVLMYNELINLNDSKGNSRIKEYIEKNGFLLSKVMNFDELKDDENENYINNEKNNIELGKLKV